MVHYVLPILIKYNEGVNYRSVFLMGSTDKKLIVELKSL